MVKYPLKNVHGGVCVCVCGGGGGGVMESRATMCLPSKQALVRRSNRPNDMHAILKGSDTVNKNT